MSGCSRWLMLLIPCSIALAGCVTQSTGADGTSYHYQRLLALVTFVAGIAFIPIGMVVRMHSARTGWILMILGPVAALLIAPMFIFERVFVSDQGFEVRSGFLGRTANHDISFDSIRSIRIAQEKTTARRGRTIDVLYFDLKTGPGARLPLNNDVKITAATDIIRRASARGIPVSGLK